jgi:hypothetical protein
MDLNKIDFLIFNLILHTTNMTDLPFEINKNHKTKTKYKWLKILGLKTDNFEEIYNKYIYATHCELCNKEFTKTKNRHMEHCHTTGQFRNIVCTSCNALKSDVKVRTDNTSGYIGISKHTTKTCKQGFIWKFRVHIDGKQKTIKQSINFDKLVEFAEKWKKDNNYYK